VIGVEAACDASLAVFQVVSMQRLQDWIVGMRIGSRL
jgi:hypothetical protein